MVIYGGVSLNGRERIAFVCQRYGAEVNGGAELHCFQLTNKLAEKFDVTVYTTCALDYVTWKNHYPAGEEQIGPIRVKRYAVDRERDKERFDRLSEKILGRPHTDRDEEKWIDEQGPYCPALIKALEKEHGEYRVVFFMTYLYYLTAKGLPLGFDNAMLVPTVHDEPPVYLRWYEKVFAAAKGICWNSEEEKAFANRRFPMTKDTPGIMAGVGVDGPPAELPEIPEAIRGKKYLVYVGRIDGSKGCGEMFAFFRKYREECGKDISLVLMGKPVMDIPEDEGIIPLGFVSEEMKFAVMNEAFALVLFSRFESLSMVVLESLRLGRPVIVNGQCEVLKGHCLRSNAGLYFGNYPEFRECVKWMSSHPAEYEVMRENGKRYVREEYSWDRIVERYEGLIQNSAIAVTKVPPEL